MKTIENFRFIRNQFRFFCEFRNVDNFKVEIFKSKLVKHHIKNIKTKWTSNNNYVFKLTMYSNKFSTTGQTDQICIFIKFYKSYIYFVNLPIQSLPRERRFKAYRIETMHAEFSKVNEFSFDISFILFHFSINFIFLWKKKFQNFPFSKTFERKSKIKLKFRVFCLL